MIFTIIILAILAGVAYYHYVQGMFTSAISAFCAFLATLVAFGYYEQVIAMAGQGKMADYAPGLVLMVLYAAAYIVLRIILDSAVPGNILVPLYVEKAGAGVFGLVVGVFTAGVFATGAQLMPFGPSIAGYTRFEIDDPRSVSVPANYMGESRGPGRDQDAQVMDQLKENNLDPALASSLMVPVDDFVVSVVSLSSANSLGPSAGMPTFPDVFPNFLDQAFANRLGPDRSGWRVFITSDKVKAVDIRGVYTLSGTPEFLDSESSLIRPNKASLNYRPAGGEALVVVRGMFGNSVLDSDGVFRMTPASIRLVTGGKVYHPIGTMARANRVALYRLDDQILTERGVDLVFSLPKQIVDRLSKPVPKGQMAREVGFIEFKLFSRHALVEGSAAAYPGEPEPVLMKAASPAAGGAPKAD